ncbi:MAG: hypothetical protein ACE5JU_09980 [Candidatus Binatia bacterium]
MKKIPTIFKRNPERLQELLNERHPECAWVFEGEGKATRKYDGTAMLIDGGKFYKRREVKRGKPVPLGFLEVESDPVTGKKVGWVEVDPNDPGDRWAMEAYRPDLKAGTYELLGPKIQGNPEGFDRHVLLRHAEAEVYSSVPRTMEGIRAWLSDKDIEGLVFHHPDGRMGKIKKRDFGMKRREEYKQEKLVR